MSHQAIVISHFPVGFPITGVGSELIHTPFCPAIYSICPTISRHGSARFFFCPSSFPWKTLSLLLNQYIHKSGENPFDVCSDAVVNHRFSQGKWQDKRNTSWPPA